MGRLWAVGRLPGPSEGRQRAGRRAEAGAGWAVAGSGQAEPAAQLAQLAVQRAARPLPRVAGRLRGERESRERHNQQAHGDKVECCLHGNKVAHSWEPVLYEGAGIACAAQCVFNC